MTKLLFSDIDGTLLRKDGTISPTLARKLREMGQAGHGMILCSGRPLDGILWCSPTLKVSPFIFHTPM